MKKFLFVLLIALCGLNAVYAQDSTMPPPPADPPPPDSLPIDSNIILLVLIAIGFGMYSIAQKRKTSPTQQ